MPRSGHLPFVGIPCDIREIAPHPFHAVGEKYINGVAHGATAIPLLIPGFGGGRDLESLDGLIDLDEMLDGLDGIFLPGSPSNVEPLHYGGHQPRPTTLLDRQRDSLALPLIRRVIARGMPMFAVCRGMQELNAALGGSLFQHVEEVAGRFDHRAPDAPRDVQYEPAHDISVVPGGVLHRLTGLATYRVNSLHGQGIDRLAPGLTVEAVAPDGQIEAVTVTGAPTFQLGVQWHPEWRFCERAFDHVLFTAFGEACRAYRSAKPESADAYRAGKVA